MTEYIEKGAAKYAVDLALELTESEYDMVCNAIDDAQAADVAHVKHGEWVLGYVFPGMFTPGGNRPWLCSECKAVKSWMLGKPTDNYCSNCGAKMDLRVTDNG